MAPRRSQLAGSTSARCTHCATTCRARAARPSRGKTVVSGRGCGAGCGPSGALLGSARQVGERELGAASGSSAGPPASAWNSSSVGSPYSTRLAQPRPAHAAFGSLRRRPARDTRAGARPPSRAATPRPGSPARKQLPIELERDVLSQQIVDRPERSDVRGYALVDERRGEPEDVALVRPLAALPPSMPASQAFAKTSHGGAAMLGQRVADLERPQLAVAHQPGAGFRIVFAEQAVSREVHDVVARRRAAARACRRWSRACGCACRAGGRSR